VPRALSWMRGPVGAGGRAGGAPVPSGITLARIVSSSTHVYLQKPKRVNLPTCHRVHVSAATGHCHVSLGGHSSQTEHSALVKDGVEAAQQLAGFAGGRVCHPQLQRPARRIVNTPCSRMQHAVNSPLACAIVCAEHGCGM
jgi:hypothetical protein